MKTIKVMNLNFGFKGDSVKNDKTNRINLLGLFGCHFEICLIQRILLHILPI